MSGLRAVRRRLIRDARGVTVVEFALIAPVLLLMLMGVYDLGFSLYVNAMLQGSIQQAGRNSSIEGASPSAMDSVVSSAVKAVIPGATLSFSRKAYFSMTEVARPEDFTDVDNNGVCNAGEPFEDVNGNGTWDSDRGMSGQGGARDAVLYSVTVTYPRPFAMASLAGFSNTVTMKSATVLRNQPFGLQTQSKVTKNC